MNDNVTDGSAGDSQNFVFKSPKQPKIGRKQPELSTSAVRGHAYFPVVQCIGLEYSVLVLVVPRAVVFT